jgi:hypothetical protein
MLPKEDKLDEEFYAQSKDGSRFPRRHWCFLAQVVSTEKSDLSRIFAMDGKGKDIGIAFSTNDESFDSASVQPGNTIAILYAHQHQFPDLTLGIRLETLSTVKIIPATLHDLRKLSQRIGKYFPAFDGMRICHGCENPGLRWMKCARCTRFWYCSKDCQIKGWQEKGHKKDCKILQDKDVVNLLRIEYSMWKGYYKFPISDEDLRLDDFF